MRTAAQPKAENNRPAATVRRAPGVVLQVRYSDNGRRADLELQVMPVPAGGATAARLVRSVVGQARTQGVRRLRTSLDSTTPGIWCVLDALREGDDADVSTFEMHRAGTSVLVDTRLRAPRPAARPT